MSTPNPGNPPWETTRPQPGPLPPGTPGTLPDFSRQPGESWLGNLRRVTQDPEFRSRVAGVKNSVEGGNRLTRGVRLFGAMDNAAAGMRVEQQKVYGGNQPGNNQPDSTAHSGAPGDYSPGDPDRPASSSDFQGLHDALQSGFADLSDKIGGQNQNLNGQQFSPERMQAPESPLAVSARQRQSALEQGAAASQSLQATKANSSARFAARQARCTSVTTSGSGLGASASMNEAAMNGTITPQGVGMPPSGNGSSASSSAAKKWR